MNNKTWKHINSTIKYQNPWLTLREDTVITPEGKNGLYSIIQRKPSIFILPITPKHEIYLIYVWRYTTQSAGWELPAGGIFEKEDVVAAANRELQEETGITGGNCLIAGKFETTNSISDQIAYTVVASELDEKNIILQKEEGVRKLKKFTIPDIFKMIGSGDIVDGQTITALFQGLLFLKLI